MATSDKSDRTKRFYQEMLELNHKFSEWNRNKEEALCRLIETGKLSPTDDPASMCTAQFEFYMQCVADIKRRYKPPTGDVLTFGSEFSFQLGHPLKDGADTEADNSIEEEAGDLAEPQQDNVEVAKDEAEEQQHPVDAQEEYFSDDGNKQSEPAVGEADDSIEEERGDLADSRKESGMQVEYAALQKDTEDEDVEEMDIDLIQQRKDQKETTEDDIRHVSMNKMDGAEEDTDESEEVVQPQEERKASEELSTTIMDDVQEMEPTREPENEQLLVLLLLACCRFAVDLLLCCFVALLHCTAILSMELICVLDFF